MRSVYNLCGGIDLQLGMELTIEDTMFPRMDIITKYGEIHLDYSRWIKLYYEVPSFIEYLDCNKNYNCQFDLSSKNVECKILFTNKSFARSLQFNLRKNTEKYYTMIDIPKAFVQLN
jgi:hypothetical protein